MAGSPAPSSLSSLFAAHTVSRHEATESNKSGTFSITRRPRTENLPSTAGKTPRPAAADDDGGRSVIFIRSNGQ